MKRKLISMVLAIVMVLTLIPGAIPTAEAASQFDFPNQVANPLITPTVGKLPDSSVKLEDPEETDFIGELTGPMPNPRYFNQSPTSNGDYFLIEPTGPMPSFPGEGRLMEPLVPAPEGEEEPTPISTAEELQAATKGSFILMNDIDLEGVDWTPVDLTGSFTLDGNGHTVRNLELTGMAGRNMGLYDSGGYRWNFTVRNLILQDFTFTDLYGHVGALIGAANGPTLVENCAVDNVRIVHNTAPIDDNLNAVGSIGGLIGWRANGDVALRACSVTGSFLSGLAEDDTKPRTPSNIGGLVGELSGNSVSVTDCITDFDIDMTDFALENVGGMIGEGSSYSTLSLLRCASYSDIAGLSGELQIAGLAATLKASKTITVTDCVYGGVMESGQGGLVGRILSAKGGTTFRNCVCDGTFQTLSGRTDSGFVYDYSFGGILGNGDDYDGSGDISFEHCMNLSDITVTSVTGSSYFRGFFVGGIVGFAPEDTSYTDCLNLGDLSAAESVPGSCCFGGLAGAVYDSDMVHILRCENRGDLISPATAGGLVGFNVHKNMGLLILTDCRNTGDIVSTDGGNLLYKSNCVGGLVGSAQCRLLNCVNTGDVSGGACTGGLMGGDGNNGLDSYVDGFATFQNCRSSGTITGGSGFIDGCSNSPSFINCTANVKLPSGGAGLIGNGSNVTIQQCSVIVDAGRGGYGLVVGGDGTIQDCYAVVTSGEGSGAGLGSGGFNIENCAAEVDLSASGSASVKLGGLLASSTGSYIVHSYAVGTIRVGASEDTKVTAYVGGLVGYVQSLGTTIGQCYGGVDVKCHDRMGALVGFANDTHSDFTTIYSCWSDASVTGSGTVGGLVGEGQIYMQDSTFLGSFSTYDCGRMGGLVGIAEGGFYYNCYYSGSVSAKSAAGGLIGRLQRSYDPADLGLIRSCRFDGTVTSESRSGGIVGWADGTVEDCHVSGYVSGQYAGGIVGTGSYLLDCTSSATVASHSGKGEYSVGGIVGAVSYGVKDSLISNCHVTTRVSDWFSGGEAALGGLAGEFSGTVIDSSSCGASATMSGGTFLMVGGLVGSVYELNDVSIVFKNCRVTGSTYGSFSGTQSGPKYSGENVAVGGLFGYAEEPYILAENCSVLASVSGSRSASKHWDSDKDEWVKAGGHVSVGGLGGFVTKLKVDNCTFTGTRSASGDDPYTNHRLLGYKDLDDGTVVIVPPEEQEEVNHTFIVKADEWGDITGGRYQPKEGVTVAIGGIPIGKTDKDGKVEFTNNDLIKTSATVMRRVTANLTGYTEALRFMYMADGATTTLYIGQLKPGLIKIKSAQYQEAGSQADLLSYLNDVRVPEIDDGFKKTYFEVEWNDSEPEMRTVFLTNEAGNKEYLVDDCESNYVQYAELFEPGEDIYVGARAFWKNPETGETEEVSVKEKLSIRVEKLHVNIPTPVYETDVSSGSGEEDDGPYFLQGLKWSMGFNNIGPFAGEVSLKNNYLRLKFSNTAKKEYKIPLWGSANGSGGVSIGLEGDLSIPYVDTYTGEWSGKVKINLNDLPTVDLTETASVKYHYSTPNKSLFNLKYPFTIPVPFPPYTVPCFFDSKLDLGGTAELWITGPHDAVEVYGGSLNGAGYCEIFTGIGEEVADQAALKFGGEGRVNPKFHLEYSTDGDDVSKSMAGDLSAKALIKAFDHSITAKLQLGTYLWDGEKTTWTVFGQEIGGNDDNFSGGGGDGAGGGSGGGRSIELMSLDDADWHPLTRAYLAEGGGFHRGGLSLFGFSTDTSSLRYDNISEISEAVLAVENGQLVLYFTANDGNGGTAGTVGEHTALFRSVHSALGWSSPDAISTTGAYPDDLFADGTFVVWTESSDASSVAAVLTSTDVKAAISGGNVQTFEGNGYVYAPKVSTDGTKALVTWLRDPSLTDADATQGTLELWYATYDGSVWSEATMAKITENPVSSQPDCAADLIYYGTDRNARYSYKISSKSSSQKDTGLIGRTVTLGGVTASFAENGALTIRMDGKGSVLQQTNCITGQKPVLLLADGTYYLFWAESSGIRMMIGDASNIWSQPILAVPTEDLPEDLSAVVVDSTPYVSYYHQAVSEDGTHHKDLHTAQIDPNNVDLVLQSVGFNREDLLTTGILTLQGNVYNNGLAETAGFTITVKDSEGKTVCEKTVESAVTSGGLTRFSAAFVPTSGANTYSVTVQPSNTSDSAPVDNTLALPFEAASATIRDASFVADKASGGVQLETFVQNDGLVPLDLTLSITTENGEVIQTFPVETAVPRGSYRQFLLDGAQPDTYYQVTLYSGETALDSTMLRYEDPTATTLSVIDLEIESGKAALSLSGKNHETAARQLILALYEDEKMVSCGSAIADDLNGKQTVEIQIGTLPSGSYRYKLFVFTNTETAIPYIAAKTGSVKVE